MDHELEEDRSPGCKRFKIYQLINMYYRDQYGNVVEYSPEGMGQYSNAIHPGGVGYHPLTREDFSFADVTSWFEKYKMWFLYALIIVVVFIVLMWWWNKNKAKKSAASVFY
jgi:hypothetical protein